MSEDPTRIASQSGPAEQPSQFFGRYRAEGLIGRGAMGEVYRGHDPLLERNVAIKIVKTDLLDAAERSDYLQRFTREARAAARCSHRNIVGVFDYSENAGAPFIVMELVEGQDLRQVIRETPGMAAARAQPIMAQILDALAHAHALGIVHRDIKPANILLLAQDIVKITDFGIARLEDAMATQLGFAVGTPRYMAPEQARGEVVDHRADLFSAAAVFSEMLTGQPPFAGSSQEEILYRVMHGEPQGLTALEAGPDAALAVVLRRALAKAKEARFPSAAQFAASLLRREPAVPAQAEPDHVLSASGVGHWPPGTLERAEKELAIYLGPLAKVLVRRDAASAADPGDLHRRLARHLHREAERTKFLARCAARQTGIEPGLATVDPMGSTGRGTVAPLTILPALHGEAQAALTPLIGPIARILVRKAAERAKTPAEFIEILATGLPNEADRAAFRRKMGQV